MDRPLQRLKQLTSTITGTDDPPPQREHLPTLPPQASYLFINNPTRRNALSLAVLRDLRDQLHRHNTSPSTGKLRILPPFKPEILDRLEAASKHQDAAAREEYGWLFDTDMWLQERGGLPKVIVLRSQGPVFCSGHDLDELRKGSYEEVKEIFALCAEVMNLIRQSPAPVVGVIQGLATAAGCQLALSPDLPIACASTQFHLPGNLRGMPCTSPSTAVARRLGTPFAYRMFLLADHFRADQLPVGAVETVTDNDALEKRVAEIVSQLSNRTAGQPQALGKWAYWTHVGMTGSSTASGGDGYADAAAWTGRVMALHNKAGDAKEGTNSFFEKRKPVWKT